MIYIIYIYYIFIYVYILYVYIYKSIYANVRIYISYAGSKKCKAIKLVSSSLSNNEVVSVETICQGKKTILKTCQVTVVN